MPKAAIYGTAMAVLAMVANLLHAVSHIGQHVLSLEAWQWVYVICVIFVAPIAAALLLWTRYRLAGAWLLLVSMAGSFVFDFAYHFLVPGPDNVFTLWPDVWSIPFWGSAVLLVVVGGIGTLVGGPGCSQDLALPGHNTAHCGTRTLPARFANGGQMIQREPHQATEARTFDRHRPLLFSIAYRMLGSAMDAEDIVQEAYLRWQGTEDEVRSPKAYLSTVVTRLAIDRLRSAKARREQYVGPWLSEPLATGGAFDPAEAPVMEEPLSMGCLVLLESLTPVERAIFLLREVNGQPGIIVYAGDLPDSVLTLEIVGGRIKAIRNVRNPDKLQAVPRLSEINRRWTATAG